MKKLDISVKHSFIKKIFIKICRILGYEIIDQSNMYIPTQKKSMMENLSVHAKKSIILPLGEVKITRKVKKLTIIFRSCTSVNMLTQTKNRLFNQNKSEYTFRSLNSIIVSLKQAIKIFPNIEFKIFVVDHKSKNEDLKQMEKQLSNSGFKNTIISLNTDEFVNNRLFLKFNSKNEKVTDNQMSNMSNIHQSLLIAKNKCDDLIYFVEDDYLHDLNAFGEMIFTYERLATQLNRELIICPADYPYLYTKADETNIFLGSNRHWRKVEETLCTFLTSKIIIEKYWNKYVSMCQFEHYPFEEPLHEIYKKEYCLSPIPSLTLHCTNVNSSYGLSPNMDWEEIWEKNKNY